jgi:hypothetical protein
MNSNKNINYYYMTDSDNALIYAEIKNNINSENYEGYKYLLETINSSADNHNLNNILSSTIIKKACCRGKTNKLNNNYYETDIVLQSIKQQNLQILKQF